VGTTTRFILPLTLVFGFVGAVSAQEDAKPKTARVKITAVKASGKAAKGTKPAIPPELGPLKASLGKLPYDRYQFLLAPESTGVAKAPFKFEKLPEGHSAELTWQDHKAPGDDLLVNVTISKPAKPPAKGRVKVATLKVRSKNGASFVVQCPGAYADGDLLLVVTATRTEKK
jgi:hypothetical protein